MDLKRQHEEFIINEEGSSTLRYIVFCLQMSLSIFISKLFINTFPSIQNSKLSSFLIEFICLHTFTIFSATILDDYYLLVFFSQIMLILFILYAQVTKIERNTRSKTKSRKDGQSEVNEAKPKNEAIRSISLNVLISTTILILAVDFKVFPRRNAKIEHFGLGLMDGGAICFLSLNAVFSPEVRLLMNKQKNSTSSNGDVIRQVIVKCLNSSMIVLLIGLIRLYTIKKMNYQEHVSEYGVHMNFFILLALVKVTGMLITLLFRPQVFHPFFGFGLICVHEILLKCGMSKYLQSDDERNTFLDKNKESLCALVGYVGFYLSAYCSAEVLMEKKPQIEAEKQDKSLDDSFLKEENLNDESSLLSTDQTFRQNLITSKYRIILRSFKYALVYFVVFWLSDAYSEHISRRNMNMAFTCLKLCIIYLLICLENFWTILLIRYYSISNSKLIIRNAYTNNGLIAFLFANILTGLVNMSTNSLETSDLTAICTLFAYSFVVAISVCFLDFVNKFFN